MCPSRRQPECRQAFASAVQIRRRPVCTFRPCSPQQSRLHRSDVPARDGTRICAVIFSERVRGRHRKSTLGGSAVPHQARCPTARSNRRRASTVYGRRDKRSGTAGRERQPVTARRGLQPSIPDDCTNLKHRAFLTGLCGGFHRARRVERYGEGWQSPKRSEALMGWTPPDGLDVPQWRC